ncbi:hypothetical protein A2U01_0099041, partial [Trifolium medium]|nr:hypothetical protein [Trifolium medium]
GRRNVCLFKSHRTDHASIEDIIVINNVISSPRLRHRILRAEFRLLRKPKAPAIKANYELVLVTTRLRD